MPSNKNETKDSHHRPVATGFEVLREQDFSPLKGSKVGLITNHTGVSRELYRNIDVMIDAGVKIQTLFGPEHGLAGAAPDGEFIADQRDEKTNLPIYSLYGEKTRPEHEVMKNIDLLVADIQDVGVRFYTYLYAVCYAVETAAQYGIQVMVLDRPNPIRGDILEGSSVQPDFASYVGDYNLPFRIGMTVAEVACYANELCGWEANIEPIPMKGWERQLWLDETDVPWVLPSPNLPTIDTAVVYPGTVLFEGTNCSEGRGTTRPFEIIGAPWINAAALTNSARTTFEALNIQGVLLREAHFVPTTSKHEGKLCHGVQLHVTDREQYQPVRTAITLLKLIRDLHRKSFKWRDYRRLELAIDQLSGSNTLRKFIDADAPFDEIFAQLLNVSKDFQNDRQKHLLYA